MTYIHQMTDNIFINLIVVPKRRSRKIQEISRHILEEPSVSLYLAQGDSFYWISLEHALDEVFDVSRDLTWHVVITLLYFREKEG